MALKWKTIYSVNVKKIDGQHKKLFVLINKVFETENKSKEEIFEIIKEMEDYSNYHFKTEEKYFELFNYKDKEIHKKEHRLFIDKVEKFKSQIREEDYADVTESISVFLEHWWINHVLNSDLKYTDLFNQNGLY